MKLDSFNYDLPESLIAQEPLDRRSGSRLLVCKRHTKSRQHDQFSNLLKHLPNDALVVFNNTKVINARLYCTSPTGASIECFLVEQVSDSDWLVMAKPSKRLKLNETYVISESFTFTVLEKHVQEKLHLIRFSWDTKMSLLATITRFGEPPLPPYIKTEDADHYSERYQTIFASELGAIAAPTAGLHFDEEMLSNLSAAGIETCSITLHVGFGTFTPITTESILDHTMHFEQYSVSDAAAETLNRALSQGRPIIAVGTTVCRCLEAHVKDGQFSPIDSGKTNLYITPGYTFKVVKGLVTNFHLPKSSLLILVSALAGVDTIKEAYLEAVQQNYRFYSFGDAMLLL